MEKVEGKGRPPFQSFSTSILVEQVDDSLETVFGTENSQLSQPSLLLFLNKEGSRGCKIRRVQDLKIFNS